MTDGIDFSTRTALPGDAGAIREVVRAAYARWVPIIGREPLPMQADYEVAVRNHRFDLIEHAGRIVALIETEARDGHYWIENVAVLPDWQGHGLGRRLLAQAEALAREAGLPQIRLLTNGRMVANRRLYVSVGYKEDREEPFTDGTVVYLSKRL
ncbi:MAG: GNAT family N-acetyltransferase [Hyphomicrobiales bacterium]|nr:MAG: GNAT family N-acetyltransferase [Hyphomicrobiales bacterium]